MQPQERVYIGRLDYQLQFGWVVQGAVGEYKLVPKVVVV
jgi:hypothetical protein